MSDITINLIGAGRVGTTLLGLFKSAPGYVVQDVLSTKFSAAQAATQATGAGHAVESYADLRPADLWFLTVPDTRISEVAAKLALRFEGDDKSAIAVHCSGFCPAREMAALEPLSWRLASCHPVMSFGDLALAQQQFDGALCGLEGDAEAVETLRLLFESRGAQCFTIASEQKSLYHAAAVISNNFTVVLQAIARDAWSAAGVPDDTAQKLNAALLRSTYENVVALGPRAALTGPAARGDTQVVTRQGQDVAKWNPSVGRLYKELSTLAHGLKTTGLIAGVDDDAST